MHRGARAPRTISVSGAPSGNLEERATPRIANCSDSARAAPAAQRHRPRRPGSLPPQPTKRANLSVSRAQLLSAVLVGLSPAALDHTNPPAKTGAASSSPAKFWAAAHTVSTHGSITVGGHVIHYTAKAGTVILRDKADNPTGEMFYVAYFKDGAKPGHRPIAFLYTAGPGGSSTPLHIGMGRSLAALNRGAALADTQEQTIAAQRARYTGLSEHYLLKADLRVTGPEFEHELLSAGGKTTGRLDARLPAPARDPLAEYAEYDPLICGTGSAYVSAANEYPRHPLHFGAGHRPVFLSAIVGNDWQWEHTPPGAGAGGTECPAGSGRDHDPRPDPEGPGQRRVFRSGDAV